MTKRHKPRSGSMAFYPRKRALRETPSLKTFPLIETDSTKVMNFLGYKAGMLHMIARDEHEKASTYGHEVMVPATAIECPPLRVFGVRAYEKTAYGLGSIGEVTIGKPDKDLLRRIKAFKKKQKKKGKKGEAKETEAEKEPKQGTTIANLEGKKESISEIRLLVHTTPRMTGIGKKKPAIVELKLTGNIEQQLAYAKEKLGNEITVGEVFKNKQFVDVKAVDKGKGFTGPVKRFGIKIQRPKAKKHRIVGSIGPWNPSTVMFTVARAGQHGYQTRTEYNKRILVMGNGGEGINPASGFKNYGTIKNDFVVFSGSIPGPAKRAVAFREPIRKTPNERFHISDPIFISTVPAKASAVSTGEEEGKAKKVVVKKEEAKKETKSVADEIAAAAAGKEEKREKKKE